MEHVVHQQQKREKNVEKGGKKCCVFLIQKKETKACKKDTYLDSFYPISCTWLCQVNEQYTTQFYFE